MDSDLWISRLAAAKRHYSIQQHQSSQSDRFGVDEFEVEEEVRSGLPCPFCDEDHDITSLCSHLEDDHPFESKVALKFANQQSQVRTWVLKSFGVKWRNYKTALKTKYWDGRPTQEVIDGVPEGIDALQWASLVSTWTESHNKSTKDYLLLFRISRMHKDGTWTLQDAKEKWELACKLLAESELTLDFGDFEANERVFVEIMGKEHSGRVRCIGFGVTLSTYYPETSSSTGCSKTSGSGYIRFDECLTTMENDVGKLKETVNGIQGTIDEMYKFIREQAKKENKNQPLAEDN